MSPLIRKRESIGRSILSIAGIFTVIYVLRGIFDETITVRQSFQAICFIIVFSFVIFAISSAFEAKTDEK